MSDPGYNRIQEFMPNLTFVRMWGRHGGTDGSAGSGPGEFNAPVGMAFGPDGNLYVADFWNERVQVFTPTGQFVRQLGDPGTALGTFDDIRYITFDHAGDLLVADSANGRIQAIDPYTGVGVWSFGMPFTGIGQTDGVTVDSNGDVLVSDVTTDTIQRFTFPAATAGALALTSVTQTTATLGGTVDPVGGVAAWTIDLGSTPSYGTSLPQSATGPSTTSQAVSVTLTGLIPNATYHARLRVSTPNGTSDRAGPASPFATLSGSLVYMNDETPRVLRAAARASERQHTITLTDASREHGMCRGS